MKDYIAVYIEVGAHRPCSGEQAILEFFAALDLAKWESLLFDITHQHVDAFEVIRPASPEFLVPAARTLLARIPPVSRVLAGQAFARLLSKFTKDASDEEAAIDLILIAPSLIGCSSSLKDLVLDSTTPRSIRIEAARAIANIKEDSSPFWLATNYKELPELAPIMVAALASSAPLKALSILFSLPAAPCPNEHLEYPLKTALAAVLESRGGRLLALDLFRRLPDWAMPVFLSTLEEIDHNESPALSEQDLISEALTRILLEKNYSSSKRAEPTLEDTIKKSDMTEGVQVLLEQWSPLAEGSGASLERIVYLFERFPSRASFAALITVGSFYIARARSGADAPNDEMKLPLIVLKALVGQERIALIEKESDKRRTRSLWSSYQGLLLLALEVEQVAELALRTLCQAEARARVIASHVIKAIGSGSLMVPACYRILSKLGSASLVDEVFAALGREVEREGDPGLAEKLGVQLYDFSPRLLDSSGLDLSPRQRITIQSQSKGFKSLLTKDPGRLMFMPGVEH